MNAVIKKKKVHERMCSKKQNKQRKNAFGPTEEISRGFVLARRPLYFGLIIYFSLYQILFFFFGELVCTKFKGYKLKTI
jgi:hypothetical protein